MDDIQLGLRLKEQCLQFTDESNFEGVGADSDGVEALTKIPTTAPQLLFTDLEMPNMDGIELTRKVRRSCPTIRVLVTSDTHQKEAPDRALHAGTHEYCDKSSPVAALIKEMESVQRQKGRTPRRVPPSGVGANLAEQMFGGLLFSSSAGLAIFDKSLRYQFINPALAAMNGVPDREHLNRTVREVLGDLADILEPKFQQVFATGKPLLNFEIATKLPNRTEPGKWIEDYFPITDSKGNVTHLAVVVVEASPPGVASPISTANSPLIDPVRIFRSWKEIARYADTSVRTAQRWERDFELPARRLRTKKGITVMAFKSDMDRWLASVAHVAGAAINGRSSRTLGPEGSRNAAKSHGSTPEGSPILRSWKEIAGYLAASVRAVQRWERELELPIRRLQMKKGVAVMAFRNDLDDWLRSKSKNNTRALARSASRPAN